MAIHAVSFDADQTLWDLQGMDQMARDVTVRTMIERGVVEDVAVSAAALVAVRDEVEPEPQVRRHA